MDRPAPRLHELAFGTPKRPVLVLARLATHRPGRIAITSLVAVVSAALSFVSARLLQATTGNAIGFAVPVAVVMSFWFSTFLNLRVLGYFPRPFERFVDRAVGPAIAVLLGALGLRTAPGPVAMILVVVTMVAMAVNLGATSISDQLRDGPTYPRSTADAGTMLQHIQRASRRSLRPGQEFYIRLNTAIGLISLSESQHTYRHLHDAYDILHDLAIKASTFGPRAQRAVAEALVETTARLYQLGDSWALYEQAVDLLELELRRSDEPYAEFWRLLTVADLKISQTGMSAGPPPTNVTGWASALHEAVEHLQRALPLAPRHRVAELHFRLALCHGLLTNLAADPSRRSEAIAHARAAIRTITSSSRENRPFTELLLAELLLEQFAETGYPLSLIEEAERLADSIRSSRNADTSALALQVRLWALQLRDQAGIPSTGPGVDLRAAAAEVTSLQPCSRARLRVAAMLANWAAGRDQPASAAWGYREALATARNISATGLVRKQQQAPLYEVGGFAAEAAHWLLECGRPAEAVEAIEAGRALVLTSAVHRDMLVRRLESFDPGLARRCAELSDQLARVDGHSRAATPRSGQLWTVVTERRAARAAHDEWQRLAGWLSRWPEFRALLEPPGYGHVSAAARWRPLVYLVAARRSGYALIVTPGSRQPDVLRLDGLTTERVAEVTDEFMSEASRLAEPIRGRTHWQAALASCLDWLRDHAMQPLAERLHWSGPVALIPAGDLALLPLHAACEVGGPTGTTYTFAPSAPVIAHASEAVRARRSTMPPKALVVASAGPQDQQLQYVGYAARALGPYAGGVTELSGATATRTAALAALASHDVYHFACHGATDGSDPLESHLLVADGRLTVRDLLEQRLRGRLAVLAACETGVPYAQLPDESIGLPAALLEAGVPGIVATLWPVEEIPTMLLTTRFYELWLHFGQNPAVALKEAQNWLRTSTYGQLEAYVRKHLHDVVEWPYRHTGGARQHTMFAHPDHWAAFPYTGI
jgi:tetratricopeptide (TPR) repeat protein